MPEADEDEAKPICKIRFDEGIEGIHQFFWYFFVS